MNNGNGGGGHHNGHNKPSTPPSFMPDNRPYYQQRDNMDNGNGGYQDQGPPPRMQFDGPPGGPRGPRFRPNGHRDFAPYPMRPPHMQDVNFPMHRMNFGPPPPPPPPYPHRGDYGPPPPHFRGGQW